MVVVRDEVFKDYDIERNNAARIVNEQLAREQRQAAPVRDNRRDAQQPAFSTPRAYPSKTGNGGGAMGPWALVLLLPLLLAGTRKRLF
jgi:Ca-activated chloride channel family protein